MTFELGVIVCWFFFLVWACSSGIARALSMEGYQRSRLIGMPSRLPLLLALSFMLCLSLRPAQALAAEPEPSVDETEKLDKLPDNFFEVMESRTSGDQYVAVEGDRAILKSAPSGAKSAGSDLALDIFKDMVADEISSNTATQRIMHDLAWRYYAHPDKRDKIPLWKMRDYDPGYGYAVYSLQECTSYGDWCAKNKYFNTYFAGFLTASFQLRELNHQGKSWDASSPAASEIFSDWYYYYEGRPSSGEDIVQVYSSPITMFRSFGNVTNTTASDATLSCTSTQLTTLNSRVQNKYSIMIYYRYADTATTGATTSRGLLITSISPISVTYTQVGSSNYTNYQLSVTSSGSLSYYRWSPSNTTTNNWDMYTAPVDTLSGSAAQQSFQYVRALYSSRNIGDSSGTGSDEPVPSPGAPSKPQPQQPIITTVNSPTYNNVTYQTISQTDVDLQPIIDALAVHDENMQDAWNAYSILFDDWMNTLKAVIENWEQVWLDWTNTLYQDLQYYLDGITYVLYEILQTLQMQPYIDVPTPETITINYDGAVDNLKTRFPFSIPWDIKLILELLDQPPTAPEFDFPVLLTEYTVHIDLSPLEPMAEILRFMSDLFFLAGLLMVTRKVVGW